MEKTIILLLAINFFVMLFCFWYVKRYLDDIHSHVYDDEEAKKQWTIFQSMAEGWREGDEKEEPEEDAK